MEEDGVTRGHATSHVTSASHMSLMALAATRTAHQEGWGGRCSRRRARSAASLSRVPCSPGWKPSARPRGSTSREYVGDSASSVSSFLWAVSAEGPHHGRLGSRYAASDHPLAGRPERGWPRLWELLLAGLDHQLRTARGFKSLGQAKQDVQEEEGVGSPRTLPPLQAGKQQDVQRTGRKPGTSLCQQEEAGLGGEQQHLARGGNPPYEGKLWPAVPTRLHHKLPRSRVLADLSWSGFGDCTPGGDRTAPDTWGGGYMEGINGGRVAEWAPGSTSSQVHLVCLASTRWLPRVSDILTPSPVPPLPPRRGGPHS